MGILNQTALADIQFDLEMSFIDQLESADRVHEKIAMVDRTNQPLKRYKWIRNVPRMVKWVGERRIEKLTADSHVIENEDWAIGIEVDRDDVRNDEFGSVEKRVRGLVDSAFDTFEEQVVNAYVNGFDASGGLSYDGQFLIDSDHTVNGDGTGTSQSNLITPAFSKAGFEEAYQKMIGFIDDKGKGLKVRPKYLLHGPSTWSNVRDVLLADVINSGDTNLNRGLVTPIMTPHITDNKWFLIGEAGGMSPVILQIRQDPEFRAPVTSLEDFQAFRTKTFYYGVDATFGVAPAAWQLVVGSNATT